MFTNLIIDLFIYTVILIISLLFILFSPSYKENIIYITKNIIKVYRNFFHWNLSKIVIWIYSRIFWIIINIPIAIIVVGILYSISSSVKLEWVNNLMLENKIDYWLVSLFLSKPFAIISVIILSLVMLYLFIFAMMYWELLQQNIFINYFKWEKLKILKNYYLNYKLIWKFFKLFFVSFSLILLPIILAWIYIIVILLSWYFVPFIKDLLMTQNIYFSIINLLILASFFVILINIILRLPVVNYVLLYSDDFNKKPLMYIKEVFKITKGKTLKIIGLAIPFFAISLFIWSITDYLFSQYIRIDFIQYVFNFLIFWGIIWMFFLSIYQILTNKNSSEFSE